MSGYVEEHARRSEKDRQHRPAAEMGHAVTQRANDNPYVINQQTPTEYRSGDTTVEVKNAPVERFDVSYNSKHSLTGGMGV